MLVKPLDALAERAVISARIPPPSSLITCLWRCTDVGHYRQQAQRVQPRHGARSPPLSFIALLVARSKYRARAAPDGNGSVEPIILQQPSAQKLDDQTKRLAQQVAAWLDDEWLPQDVHRDLGNAAAEVRHLAESISSADCTYHRHGMFSAAAHCVSSVVVFACFSGVHCERR